MYLEIIIYSKLIIPEGNYVVILPKVLILEIGSGKGLQWVWKGLMQSVV
jgi:hypothetical protein